MAIATFEIGSKQEKRRRSRRPATLREVCLILGGATSLREARSVGDRLELGGRSYRVAALNREAGSPPYVHLAPPVG